jgi:hypothetical protein
LHAYSVDTRPSHGCRISQLAISALVFGLVFFYIIPITFVQSLANIKELSARLPFLEYVWQCSAAPRHILVQAHYFRRPGFDGQNTLEYHHGYLTPDRLSSLAFSRRSLSSSSLLCFR